MKLLFTMILLIVSCTIAFAQGGIAHPATPRLMVDADGNLVSKINPLPVDADVSIGSITVDVFPVYANLDGDPATASVDLNNHVLVNISSETAGITTAIEGVGRPVANIEARVISLGAGVSSEIAAALIDRRFIEIAAHNAEAEFFINFGAPAGADTIRKVYGSIYLELPESVVIHVWSSGGGNFSVIEGGD